MFIAILAVDRKRLLVLAFRASQITLLEKDSPSTLKHRCSIAVVPGRGVYI